MTINQKQDELIENFELFDDWEQKYEYIIDLGKKLEPLSPVFKIEENVIKGCQSLVWLNAFKKDGKVYFEADSEAIIVKGLISMVVNVLSGQKPEDIVTADLYFIEKIGLGNHLAQTRSNGLAAMVKQMKTYALAYLDAEN